MSPRIIDVAVPLPKHSPIFGQEASSQTVCRFCSRRIRLISWKRESGAGARTRIQAGFWSFSLGKNLSRSVLSAPFSLTPASRMLEFPDENGGQVFAECVLAILDAQVAGLRHPQSRKTAGVDGGKRRQVHVDVEREAMERTAARHADAEGGNLGATNVNTGRPRLSLGALAKQVDDRL